MGGFVLYKHGSALLETPGFRGASHLGEHLFARSYMRFGDAISTLGLNANACTHGHKIEFYGFGLESSVLEFITNILLHDNKYVLRHVPSREDFERERNVVIQEYEGALSDPRVALWLNIQRKHYGYYSGYGYLEDLRNLTYDAFVEFYDATFRQFTGIAYVGNIEKLSGQNDALPDWAHPEFWMVPGRENELQYITKIAPTLPELASDDPEYDPNYKPEFFGGSDRETIIMDWIGFDCHEYERKIISQLWNCGTADSSPLMVELRKKAGLCYAAYIDVEHRPTNMLSTWITTAPENVSKVREITRNVFTNYQDHITYERYMTTCSYVKRLLEEQSLLNFTHSWLTRFYSQSDTVLTLERLNEFTYERCLHLMDQMKQTWMHAEAGTSIILD